MFVQKIMRATETAVAGMILVSLGGLLAFSDTPLAGQEVAEADLTVLEMTTPATPSTERLHPALERARDRRLQGSRRPLQQGLPSKPVQRPKPFSSEPASASA